MYRTFVKPLLDRVGAAVLLVVLAPVMGVTALMIRIRLGSPVLFRQPRPGKDEKIFTLYKFRTMKEAYDEAGNPLPDAMRLTPLGRAIRGASLDELPQLFNVLRGEMSFVGPRPLLVEYLPLYSTRQRRRHEVKPGITGWAQVNGRNALDWPTRFEYDVWYVEHLSFGLDMKILGLTLLKVFRREGIAAEGSVSMEKFRGNGGDGHG